VREKDKYNIMSSILYYSNFCEPSKKLLQTISKTQNAKDIHFICIDKRVKDNNGKAYIILPNGQKIIMPENVTKVPALLLLNNNYKVVYGDDIYTHLRPQKEVEIKAATQNNMEPGAFQDGFGSFGCGGGIISDNFSFLDQNDKELGVSGEGGMRQMHNYVSLNDADNLTMQLPGEDYDSKNDKIKDGDMEAFQRKRNQDIDKFKTGY